MANPLSNEQSLYERIKNENITVDPLIWDTMYHYLGDYVSAISFIALISVDTNEPVSIEDAKKILEYTEKIIETVRKILHAENIDQDDDRFEQLKKENMSVHPLIRDFFAHHISNDIHCINFRVSFYLDPLDEQPIPVEEAEKLLCYTSSIGGFLDKLREATHKEAGY